MSDIRKVEHLVGIDFGDGETTASVISFDKNGNSKEVQSLNIFNIGTPNRQKVESCIYQKPDGTWELASNDIHFSKPSLKTNFKNMPSELRKQKEYAIEKEWPEYEQKEFQLKTFVKLVFDRILKNNSSLWYDPETKEKNFYLIAACPSKWAKDSSDANLDDDKEILAYKSLLNEVIPVDSVIKESDAAFFHFITEERFPIDGSKSLVIDFGSSTIDYTLFCIKDGKKSTQSDGSSIRDLGASKVEATIQEYLETTPGTMEDFQAAKDKWKELCQRHNETNVEWEPAIRHNLKQAKEGYYSSNLSEMNLNVPLKSIWDRGFTKEESEELKPFYFYCTHLPESAIEDEQTGCLKGYKESVRAEFMRIAANWNPDHIIITGGASRMPWVEKEVRRAFEPGNENVTVKVDTETPSFIVSHGCARYLLAYRNFTLKFDSLEQRIAQADYMSDTKIRAALNNVFNSSMKSIIEKRLKEILQDYADSPINASFYTLARKIDDFHKNTSDYLTKANFLHANLLASDKLSDFFSSKVAEDINSVFEDSFGIPIRIPVSIDFDDCYDENLHIEDSLEQVDWIIRHAYSNALFFSIPGFVNMDKARDKSERRILVENYPIDYILNPQDNYSKEISELKQTVKESVAKLRTQIPFALYE